MSSIRKSKLANTDERLQNSTNITSPLKDTISDDLDENQKSFHIVGIGASAGGLSAFEAFFSGLPTDKDLNIAFVLIQHLAPDHKSILTEIIQRYTKLHVYEAKDDMKVVPNCVYIIPPNNNLALINGNLQLFQHTPHKGVQMPIDFFFSSLAEDQHDRAICIVLSGTGSDGTLGIRAVKSEGGLVIVQSPETAEYDGMPQNAIATGTVDYNLPPAEMAKQILTYLSHSRIILTSKEAVINDENALKKVFILIRSQTGHDFSKYKSSTINRRIARRLAVNQIDSINDYIRYIQQNPSEIESLFKDMLIGVTNFFRDKEVFSLLEESIIPALFDNKPVGSTIRAWCAGCSTGEEAYSIAILLQERLDQLKKNFNIQIFATDIDSRAISLARAGVFSQSISRDVSSERLARFFTTKVGSDTYRINKNIRDLLIFSEQNVIKDPPFSKLDLISCRNLMIYLNKELQAKLIPVLHYSLNPGGYLLLGNSETIGDNDALFTIVDRKAKVFRKKDNILKNPLSQLILSTVETDIKMNKPKNSLENSRPLSLKDLTEQSVLKESSMVGILINEQGDILYIHGRSGLFLELNPGEAAINNILKMAREGLKYELIKALHKMIETKETVRVDRINVKTNGHYSSVNLIIKALDFSQTAAHSNPLYVVLLDVPLVEIDSKQKKNTKNDLPMNISTELDALKAELRIKEEYLQTSNEELETSNEELKSANEELQSVNEELQSTNEELETSKEELQSINEELTTVNSELQQKVHDLSQLNNDMNNLLSGTNIATVFLDLHQNILRFTPEANKIVNLISSDIGRPFSHIVNNIVDYTHLISDIKKVLDTLIPMHFDIQTTEGKWFNMIIQPYRTISNVIEGTVITFVDINDAVIAKDALALSELSYRTLFDTSFEGIVIVDALTGKILKLNKAIKDMLGYSDDQSIEKEVWNNKQFSGLISHKQTLSKIEEHNHFRFESVMLKTVFGQEINVEIICNYYELSGKKYIQFNIRNLNPQEQQFDTQKMI